MNKINNTLIFTFLLLNLVLNCFSQTKIKIKKNQGGTYSVPCQVNGKDQEFEFDSGASDVQLTEAFVKECLKTGVISKRDILPGIVNYKIANGDIIPGLRINIRKLKVGSLTLYNTLGSVIQGEGSFLLGQSALEQFGHYTVDYKTNTLIIKGNDNASSENEIKKKIKSSEITGNKNELEKYQKCQENYKILPEVTFEIVKVYASGDAVIVDFDITNNSILDYKTGKMSSWISIMIEVETEDGTKYTFGSTPLTDLMAGQTTTKTLPVDIRGKKPISVRIITKVAC
jgi:clan AA aspartic protease (TIGR02281 family)